MKRYLVAKREVWVNPVIVSANSAREALNRAENGEGSVVEDLFEYSTTLDSVHWTVEECYERV